MNYPIYSYVPQHILANIALYRAKQGLPPGPSAKISHILRQSRQQAALATLTPSTINVTPAKAIPTKATPTKKALGITVPGPGTHARLIYDDQNQFNFDVEDIRNEGDPAVAQKNANLAYDALGATLEFYRVVLGRNSIDNLGLNLDANVNYGVNFDNALWDGTRMVFGNGDNVIFQDFTNDVDVPGHELTHGVTQYTAAFLYTDQPGALNEATSDIFGACIDARVHGKDAGTFNWLIGEDVMAPQLYGEALRSMAYPGTAYDDPILGTDPQPATMAGYVPNGDPHINSGIINRWFYLMATDLGMNEAALIWYATLQNLFPTAQFADAAHMAAAQARILARDGKVPSRAPQTVRGTARAQGII
ncbi:M4 family metallopeptidase [Candidatus Acetothermia bacterium]|nr:M4 family metallopeptidase [Candidatus Acetothermia bacterium]